MQENITTKLSRYLRYFIYCVIAFCIVFALFFIMDEIVMPLYVRHGDEIPMPDVTGKDHFDAKKELELYGFIVNDTTRKYHPYRQAGEVLSQFPTYETKVKKGRTVYLTISLGGEKVKVPDLFQKSVRDAEILLLRNNLKLGRKIYYAFSREYPEGVVIEQLYEAGMEVPKGTIVHITVSRGQEPQNVPVPYVENKLLENAVDILEKNGLYAGRVVYQLDVNNEYLPNTVLLQDPKPGEIVAPGDSVHLWVSKIDTTNFFQK